MPITLNYTDEQARRIFEAHGFEVKQRTDNTNLPMHGDTPIPTTSEHWTVTNPTTGDHIPIQEALQRLFQRKFAMDMWGIAKMEVLDALNVQPIMSPLSKKNNLNLQS
ncbi:MAG: hypothetical protein PF444_09790 [Bacteroidales bacterium]|jgi:ribosomal protein S10|nr:hypothetical protein [Bacteroidales bacterium]